ncbi:MAG: TatD family hydrolase [Oscillospiraceae bacterium]|jgi:TatD DNase family protein|nr:TatD family hydrolase [Oscillospiraceae bacterium]
MIDTHAHYDSRRFDDDRDGLLSSLPQKGVGWFLSCADSAQSCKDVLALAEKYPHAYAACGIHPHNASEVDWMRFKPLLRQYLTHEKCVCLGEIGLDYHYDFSPREVQRALFARQLVLAVELDMPVSAHIREATEDALKLLQRCHPRGVVHCFTGSIETARILLNLGMYLGFGGAVTFKNAKKPLEAAAFCPIERLLLETDAPYMTPEPFRGKRCNSTHIQYTAQKIADARGITADELIGAADKNAERLFGIRLA